MPEGAADIRGQLSPLFGTFLWDLAKPVANVVRGDAGQDCTASLNACESTIAVQFDWDRTSCYQFVHRTSSPAPGAPSCTFAVDLEVRAILLDVPAVPDGAAVTLDLISAGPSQTVPVDSATPSSS